MAARRNVSVPDEPYESRHRAMMKNLRASLTDEKDSLYCVHTPFAVINVSVWGYAVPGFVAVGGYDEDKKYRFVVFSEEELCSFPLEIKRKKLEASRETVGFKLSLQGDSEEQA
jgi:hypothetical protein